MELAKTLHGGDVVFFQGDLGAGKTTLIRGMLRGWQFTGFVKSPSYSLIELYQVGRWQVVHVDLYRLASPSDIQHIGLADYLTKEAILLIEWPEKAEEFLPTPTLRCRIDVINPGRRVELITQSGKLLKSEST